MAVKTITPEERKLEELALESADTIQQLPRPPYDEDLAARDRMAGEHAYEVGRRAGLAEALAVLRGTTVDDEMEALEEAWVNSRTD
jgi:hypothetical protein